MLQGLPINARLASPAASVLWELGFSVGSCHLEFSAGMFKVHLSRTDISQVCQPLQHQRNRIILKI